MSEVGNWLAWVAQSAGARVADTVQSETVQRLTPSLYNPV